MSTKEYRILVIRHVKGANLGLLENVVEREQIPLEYLDTIEGTTLLRPITDYSHLIILGGPISAYEDDIYPFLRTEFKILEAALDSQIPTLGICLGSQILAKVLGGKVYRGETGREIGWYNLHLTDAGQKDLLLQGFPKKFKVFESHQDTFEIPADCVHLAATETYYNQAFRYRDFAWALQFHLEMNQPLLLACSQVIEKELLESNIKHTDWAKLLTETRLHVPDIEPLAQTFMQQFIRMG